FGLQKSIFYIGIVAVCMAAIQNFIELFICRCLLGISETGLFPGIVYYIPLWYISIEGAPTVLLADCCCFFLPDSPEHCHFLNEEQRSFEINRLAKDAGVANDHSFSWLQVLSVFKDWKTYAYMVIYIGGTISLQGVTLFLPTIISGMGQWNNVKAQLLTVPSYVSAFFGTIILSFSSDQYVSIYWNWYYLYLYLSFSFR
ncbi:unnamed protein product, partial [Didymodactylos carnosus]